MITVTIVFNKLTILNDHHQYYLSGSTVQPW
jgi:hypothetical protein